MPFSYWVTATGYSCGSVGVRSNKYSPVLNNNFDDFLDSLLSASFMSIQPIPSADQSVLRNDGLV